MKKINQANRHIINVPMPFTEEQLRLILTHCSGWEDEPENVDAYLQHILKTGKVVTAPSHELGHGADIVDIFSLGLMVYMKYHFGIDVDPTICWWHPCTIKCASFIKSVEIEMDEIEVEGDDGVLTVAVNVKTGKIVDANSITSPSDGAQPTAP
jgi:hypothetical protein